MTRPDREEHRRVVNSARTQFAAVAIGTAFIFYYVVMPITLGAAAESRGYSDQRLGFIAASFMLGVFLINVSGILWIRRYNWRVLLAASAVLATAGYAVSILWVDYMVLLVSQTICGLACGAGYGVTIACLGDGDIPERGFGLAWGTQTLLGVVLSYALPRLAAGPNAFTLTLGFLAALIVLAVSLIPLMPARGVKDGTARPVTGATAGPSPHGFVIAMGLAVIVLVFLAESGLWAYLERIAVASGMTRQFAGTAIAASLLAAAASSFLAAAIGQRLGRMIPMTIAIVTSIFSVYLFHISRGPATFLLAAVIYGAAWNFGGPYRMALVADADVTGRCVPMITSMQTLGSIIGPSLAGALAGGGSYVHVYLIASVAWTLALGLFYIANRRFENIIDGTEGEYRGGVYPTGKHPP